MLCHCTHFKDINTSSLQCRGDKKARWPWWWWCCFCTSSSCYYFAL